MDTTIQVSNDLLEHLRQMKLHAKESYEDLIWDLIEDRMELSKELKKKLAEARIEAKAGKVHKWGDIKRELKLDV
ncbi:hypothetical protein J4447_00655 [Candidatus Pacearchaeota archaeon]|nr:hypothetical protein [Candidatus Pacearchaeota archaeon]